MTDYSPDRFLIFLANHAAALHGRKLGIVDDYIYRSHITCQISDDICIDILMGVINSLYS